LFKKKSLSSLPETRFRVLQFKVTNRAPGGPDEFVAPDLRLSTPGYSQRRRSAVTTMVSMKMGEVSASVKPVSEK
jgi:hypothetical protein